MEKKLNSLQFENDRLNQNLRYILLTFVYMIHFRDRIEEVQSLK